jgi:hypothetical protein
MTMIERAARALWQDHLDRNSILPELIPPKMRGIPCRWEDVAGRERDRFLHLARVALQTIREPSEAMRARVSHAADEIGAQFDMDPDEIWRIMVDAALEEK